MQPQSDALPLRFWRKVRLGPVPKARPDLGRCWIWTGARDRAGYGRFGVEGENRMAYRVAYEALVASIPKPLEPDHLCRVRPCVNPAHMEPVTRSVNVSRGDLRQRKVTHCPKGHPYSIENTKLVKGRNGATWRLCRTCRREVEARCDAARVEQKRAYDAQRYRDRSER